MELCCYCRQDACRPPQINCQAQAHRTSGPIAACPLRAKAHEEQTRAVQGMGGNAQHETPSTNCNITAVWI